MAREFTDSNFQTEVMSSDKLTVIDFWAEWCGPCRAIGPVIEELSKEYDGKVNVGKVNVDHNPQLSINYGITSMPVLTEPIVTGMLTDEPCWLPPTSTASNCACAALALHRGIVMLKFPLLILVRRLIPSR